MEKILIASNLALWVVIIVQTLFILSLFRYMGLLLQRVPPEGLPLGQKAPRAEVSEIRGQRLVLGDSSAQGRVLIFTSPSCPWCEKLAPDVAPFARSIGSDYEVLVIITGEISAADARAYADKLGSEPALKVALGPRLMEPYRVPGTPYGIMLDSEGIVRAKGITNSLTDLQTLVSV